MSNLPTEEDIAWMTAHINDSLVADIIICCAVCSAASVIVLALRLWSRFQVRLTPLLSDWLVVGSVFFYIGFCTVFALSTRYGAGRQVILITDPADVRMLAILNICNPILYGVATALVKWSILALYLAIFPQRKFQIWVHCVSAVNLLNAVAIVLVSCLQCRPLESLWNPAVPGVCINFSHFSVFNSTFNFVIDIVILLTPLPLVRKLNSSTRKKVLLSVNFALGGSACVIAAIRVPYARRVGGTVNPSWDMIPGGLLCVVEVAVAILTASLPTFRPLLGYFGYTGSTNNSRPSAGPGKNSRTTSNFLGSQTSTRTRITTGGDRPGRRPGGISITDDISLTTHTYVDGEWVRVADEDDDDATRLVDLRKPSPYATTVSSVRSDKPY
ncbi:integral membrane protein [Colletotrichum plurivorum]|uniref:Integral membrane protein n=1 Tax=Colletotrichum plurivorum TaxID=2175906 RepID=A0A8H6N3D2_9PEZI|nr:integral membrane protein [Colletotrichum plurivorum]